MKQFTTSEISLVLANLVPIFGVFFLGWDITTVLVLYWAESGVIGVYNIIKILWKGGLLGIPIAFFFILHYGGFMLGHVIFIFVAVRALDPVPIGETFSLFTRYLKIVWPAILTLLVSHGISFYNNFFKVRHTLSKKNVFDYFSEPYKRIVLMHVTIVLGAFASAFLGNSLGVLGIFIVLKIIVDLHAHRKQYTDKAYEAKKAAIATAFAKHN